MSLVLVWRTREFYRGDIYARFRDHADVAAEESAGGGGSVAEQRPGQGGAGGSDLVESTEGKEAAS